MINHKEKSDVKQGKESIVKPELMEKWNNPHLLDQNKVNAINNDNKEKYIKRPNYPSWVKLDDNNKPHVKPAVLSKTIYQKYKDRWKLLLDQKGRLKFWEYSNIEGKWFPSNIDMIQAKISKELNDNYLWSASAENQTLQNLKGLLKQDAINKPVFNNEVPNIANFKDCVLKLSTLECMPHSPAYNLTTVTPYKIQNADKSKITEVEKWLIETLHKDGALTLMQYIGYMFYPSYNPVQAVMFLIGKGGDGKDHILSLIGRLLGDDNTKSFTLPDLAGKDSRFNGIELKWKKANLVSEINEEEKKKVLNTGAIKRYSSGGKISAQVKGGSSEDFYPHAKMVIAVNDMPKTNDDSIGWLRRLYILKAHKIKGFENKYPNFGDSMEKIKDDDLASFTLKCIVLYQKQLKEEKKRNGQYIRLHEGDESLTLKKDYLKNNNLVKLFFDTKHYTITHNKKDFVLKDDLYNSFKKWCIDFGFELLNIAEFNEKMINEGFDPKSRDRTSRGRLSSWRGIKDHGSINIDTN